MTGSAESGQGAHSESEQVERLKQYLLDIARPMVDERNQSSLYVEVKKGAEGGVLLRLRGDRECIRYLVGKDGVVARSMRRMVKGVAKAISYRHMVEVRVGDPPVA